jgi:hypothetical protein
VASDRSQGWRLGDESFGGSCRHYPPQIAHLSAVLSKKKKGWSKLKRQNRSSGSAPPRILQFFSRFSSSAPAPVAYTAATCHHAALLGDLPLAVLSRLHPIGQPHQSAQLAGSFRLDLAHTLPHKVPVLLEKQQYVQRPSVCMGKGSLRQRRLTIPTNPPALHPQ